MSFPLPQEDLPLIRRHLAGDWTAFQQLVERYQGIVCAVALSACGDISRSEDITQEVFIVAWKKLPQLREPGKLGPWLCGIARNLCQSSFRKELREPAAQAQELSPDLSTDAKDPGESAAKADDFALLWRVMGTIPENYREPLVLFYREQGSVKEVAEALDLSEEVVRQRLSRGRELLTEHVARLMESTLQATAPSAALPGMIVAAVKAAAAARVGTAAKAAGASGVMTKGGAGALGSAWLGTMLFAPTSLLLAWAQRAGLKSALAHSVSPRERRAVLAHHLRLLATLAAFYAVLVALSTPWAEPYAFPESHPLITGGILLAAMAGLITAILLIKKKGQRNLLPLQRRDQVLIEQGNRREDPVTLEYRTQASFCGLPLIHLRLGGSRNPLRRCVKAWVAIGDVGAIGIVFALGIFAVAPLSLGVVSVGIAAIGGIALGWQAAGFLADGWKAAAGAFAGSHEYAVGRFAIAPHANDATALAYVQHNPLLRCALFVIRLPWHLPPIWEMALVILVPSALVLWKMGRDAARAERKAPANSKPGTGGLDDF